jgi:hypothetical protein
VVRRVLPAALLGTPLKARVSKGVPDRTTALPQASFETARFAASSGPASTAGVLRSNFLQEENMMSEIVSYIQGLAVPVERGRGAEAGEPAPTFTSTDQAVTVRSQMAEFSAAVPQSIRPAISNGLLLGQVAADKATESNPDPMAYFSAFNSVMKKIGWQITESGFTQQSISDANAELHKAIIPIVTAIFGPGAAAASIIIKVLEGLESMSQDAPWITVFEQKSNKAKAANFGLSYVDAGAGGGSVAEDRLFLAEGVFKPHAGAVLQVLVVRRDHEERPVPDGPEPADDCNIQRRPPAKSWSVHHR